MYKDLYKYKDLREFIAAVDKLGALRRIDGADPRFEIGGITEVAAGLPDCPALLFDNIKGFPPGFRVFTNATTNVQRAALALGLDPALRPLDALKAWMEKRKNLTPQPPVTVKTAAFLENTMAGRDVDIARFPAPIWHRHDGGPFIGSGSLVIMRDPDSGWINASIYRVQVHGPNRVTVQFDHGGRHGAIIAKKYWDRGESCPVAIVHGEDPALFIAGFEYLPDGRSEYEFAGSIKGAPIEVFDGPQTGLPLPALAEIIFEGRLLPMSEATLPEGPFGEFTGYYAAAARPGPVMEVSAIHYRNDPILLGSPPMKPPRFHFGLPFRAATIWSNLEACRRHRRGRRLAACLAAHDRGGATPALRRPRQARGAGRGGAQLHGAHRRRGRRRHRSVQPRRRDVGGRHPLRAGRRHRHRAQCLELGARSAHCAGGQGARRHFALQGDHRRLPAVCVARQISADLGAVAR